MKRIIAFLLSLGLAVAVVTGRPLPDERALMDSLRSIHPRLRAAWLRDRGFPDVRLSTADSEGLHEVGRWSFGPAYDVDCRMTPAETLVAFARGSGVSLLRFSRSDTAEFQLLSDINAERLLNQVMIRDSLLFVGTNAGLETYDITDERHPTRLSWIQTGLAGFDLKDTLAFVTWYDTFKLYSIANPASPYRVGWCRDSGASVTVAGNTAFLAHRWGLYAIDITNPAAPHRVGSWGSDIISAAARGNICCVALGNPNQPEWLRFTVLDVTNPANMVPLGSIDNAGGFDLHLEDSLVFVSGYYTGGHGFQVIDIADSAHPRHLYSGTAPGAYYGGWGSLSGRMAFLADDTRGLIPVDLTDVASPVFGDHALSACWTDDIDVQGHYAYLASLGLKVLDIADPTRPVEIGHVDSARAAQCVTVCDSFAFVEWHSDFSVASAEVSDPTHPVLWGRAPLFNSAEDMVRRDSFLYIAEEYRFQVVNVARPREPQVVGTCGLGDYSYGMCLRDSLAYVSTYPLAIINVANPAQPETVGSIPRGTWSVFVKDTLAYLAAVGLHVWNVANPASPTPVDSLAFGHMVYDVVVVDSLAYLACSDGLRLANVADPHNMRVIALHSLPYIGWRLVYDSPYVYVATQDAGVCIFETTATGVTEAAKPSRPRSSIRLAPNPARDWVDIIVTAPLASPCRLSLIDVAGREVASVRVTSGPSYERRTRIDLGYLAPGLYFLRAGMEDQPGVLKIVKQ